MRCGAPRDGAVARCAGCVVQPVGSPDDRVIFPTDARAGGARVAFAGGARRRVGRSDRGAKLTQARGSFAVQRRWAKAGGGWGLNPYANDRACVMERRIRPARKCVGCEGDGVTRERGALRWKCGIFSQRAVWRCWTNLFFERREGGFTGVGSHPSGRGRSKSAPPDAVVAPGLDGDFVEGAGRAVWARAISNTQLMKTVSPRSRSVRPACTGSMPPKRARMSISCAISAVAARAHRAQVFPHAGVGSSCSSFGDRADIVPRPRPGR